MNTIFFRRLVQPIITPQFFYGIQMASRVLFLAVGLLLNRWLINNLSASDYATYNVVNDSLIPLVFVFLTLSLTSIIQKQYTNTPFDEEHREAFANIWTTFVIIRIATFFIGAAALTLINSIFSLANIWIILLLFTSQFIILLDWNYRAVCDATGRAWMFGLGDVFGKSCILAVAYALVWSGVAVNLTHYAIIMIGGYIISLLIDIVWQRQFTPWGRFDTSIIKDNIKPIITLSITSIVTYFYLFSFQLNLQILNISEEDINTFSNAYNRLFLTFISIPAIIMPNIATRLTQALQHQDYAKAKKIGWAVAGFSIAYFIAYQAGVMIILNILDPQSLYPGTLALVRILSWGVLVYPTIHLLGPLFIFFHKEKYELIVSVILAIIGLSLQFIIIPIWGIEGLVYSIVAITVTDCFLKVVLFGRILQGFDHTDIQKS